MNTLLLILLLCNQSADRIFEKGSKLTKLGPPDSAGEGPAWHPTLGILTSGHKGIHRLDPKGIASIHVENAQTNGLLFSPKGDLLACQPGKKRVVQFFWAARFLLDGVCFSLRTTAALHTRTMWFLARGRRVTGSPPTP